MKPVKESLKDLLHYWYITLIVGSFLLVAILLRIFGKPNCLIYHLFNYPCPACGLTRSWLALMQGRITEALINHPLFWMVPVIIILFLLRKVEGLKWLYKNHIIWIIMIAIFILTYIVRIIIAYPVPFINQ